VDARVFVTESHALVRKWFVLDITFVARKMLCRMLTDGNARDAGASQLLTRYTWLRSLGVDFLIPFYLQSVLVHSANCVKTCIQTYSGI
jgi:hypothetical protein